MELKPPSSTVNGRLWGARSRDWSEFQEIQSKPIYEATFQRTGLRAGTHYLDVGCGAGVAAQMAAARDARVVGIDASSEMIANAQLNVPAGDFRVADLEALPFNDNTFDVVTGFNAFQYAANPALALMEAGRVAKVGGWIVVSVWGPPDTMPAASMVKALGPLLPAPPPGAPGPFALSDEATLRAFAAEGGLDPIDVFDVDVKWEYPDEATAIRALNSSGGAVRAIEHSGETAVVEAHRRALAPFRQTGGSFQIAASFRCLMARPRPAVRHTQ